MDSNSAKKGRPSDPFGAPLGLQLLCTSTDTVPRSVSSEWALAKALLASQTFAHMDSTLVSNISSLQAWHEHMCSCLTSSHQQTAAQLYE